MKKPLQLVALAAAFASAAAANPIDLIRPDAPELADYGTLPIGVQTIDLVNPNQIDVLNINGTVKPRYNRPLTVEVWYPAAAKTDNRGTYNTVMRDGKTKINLSGRATRNATPTEGERFPLVVISHGYPGNRFLLAHLGENLGPILIQFPRIRNQVTTNTMPICRAG